VSKLSTEPPEYGHDPKVAAHAVLVAAPLMDSEQLAPVLGTTPGQLAQWRFRGDGPPFIKLGRSVRYRWSDVEAWLDANTRTQT
jgi:predicted DNA-binding transcriptional regulator AlpA